MIKTLTVLIKRISCMLIHGCLRGVPIKKQAHYDVIVVFCSLIGDYILWLAARESYKSAFKGKTSLLICSDAVKDLAILSNTFTEVVSINPQKIINSPLYHYRKMIQFKRIDTKQLICPSFIHQFSADLICSIISSPLKICYKSRRITTVRGRAQSFLWYIIRRPLDHYFDSFFNKQVEYPIEKHFSEIEAIEFFTQNIIDNSFKYKLSDIEFLTSSYSCEIDKPYALISLSSSRIIKDWPIERVSIVISNIPKHISIVLSGRGDQDLKKAEFLKREDGGEHKMINCVNETSLLEMMGLISHASFVLANDTAAIHIAAASRVTSICYTHGACFGQFVPYPDSIPEKEYHPICVYKKMECFGCNYNCSKDFDINKPLLCLRQITVDMVNKELKHMLSRII